MARSRRRLRAGDAGRCNIIGSGPLLHSAFLYSSKYPLLDLWHFNGVGGGGIMTLDLGACVAGNRIRGERLMGRVVCLHMCMGLAWDRTARARGWCLGTSE